MLTQVQVAAVPFIVWLCLVLHALQFRRVRREACSSVRSEEDSDDAAVADGDEARPVTGMPLPLNTTIDDP